MIKKIAFLTTFFLVFNSFGQEVVATDGDYSSVSSGSLSWTLGEIVVATTESPSGILTQGFQQDFENILAVAENGWLLQPNRTTPESPTNPEVQHYTRPLFTTLEKPPSSTHNVLARPFLRAVARHPECPTASLRSLAASGAKATRPVLQGSRTRTLGNGREGSTYRDRLVSRWQSHRRFQWRRLEA